MGRPILFAPSFNPQARADPQSHGDFLTPSVVGVLESNEVVVGAAARELQVTRPERSAWCFKRFMGLDKTINLGEKTYTSQELSSLVLRSLIRDAENYLNEPVTDAVITVPAYFNDHQRQANKAGRVS